MSQKLWGGRFSKPTLAEVDAFSSSLSEDQRLWKADIQGSIAHAEMLGKTGIIAPDESKLIQEGLKKVASLLEANQAELNPNAEDIHSEIERMLRDAIGPVAGKLHTARSRNDQVATATRLYLRGALDELCQEIRALQTWLVSTAQSHADTLMAGFTHLQHAQPISLGHHLMAYFWMLERDHERLIDARKRINRLPLGSAALAGTSFPIDRKQVARSLEFEGVTENSLDSVSDRDFAVEFLSASTLIGTHLSRLSEEIILWSTPEFGFIELDDAVTTGSSIMPQKKNPDVAELIRGRTGRLSGSLMGLLMTLKGLPLSYNRDLQEDKVHLFSGLDCVSSCVRLMRLMLEGAKFNAQKMATSAAHGFSNATDLADHLVTQGVAFRDAHEVTGRAVKLCIESKRDLTELTENELKGLHPKLSAAVLPKLGTRAVMEARTSEGGTSPSALKAQIELAKKRLN